jgi:alpha-L-rhamnosidase
MAESRGSLRVERPRTEYRVNPLGIDASRPRLGWILTSDRRAQRQSAYEILAASSAEVLRDGRADLWDSGKIVSPESVYVVYGGQPLRSGQRVYWTVRVWDRDNDPSPWATPAWFEMGLLEPADWRAQRITRRPEGGPQTDPFADRPGPLFRREFTVDRAVARAPM